MIWYTTTPLGKILCEGLSNWAIPEVKLSKEQGTVKFYIDVLQVKLSIEGLLGLLKVSVRVKFEAYGSLRASKVRHTTSLGLKTCPKLRYVHYVYNVYVRY